MSNYFYLNGSIKLKNKDIEFQWASERFGVAMIETGNIKPTYWPLHIGKHYQLESYIWEIKNGD